MENNSSNFKTEIITDTKVRNDLFAKVEVVGDPEVGKSSLIKRAVTDIFTGEYTPTVGYEFTPFMIKIENLIFKLQIWDMCSSDSYHSILLNLYRNAVVGILVYSVTSDSSFKNLDKWVTELRRASPEAQIVLIGNKIDLEEDRVISTEQGKKFAKDNNISLFFELSAKDGFDEEQNFLEKIAIYLYKEYLEHKDDESGISAQFSRTNESIMLTEKKRRNIKGKGCC